MFKKGQKLIRRPSSTNSKVHRSEHSSDFHAYAVALNPTFEMSSERSISITAGRQMSTHSQFSRHRTSRGEVSYREGGWGPREWSMSITGRQMSTHSQFSRHRTSRGEVSNREGGRGSREWRISINGRQKSTQSQFSRHQTSLGEVSNREGGWGSREWSISITGRQMSTHSQFSRHRTSRGEVSNREGGRGLGSGVSVLLADRCPLIHSSRDIGPVEER